VLAEADIACLQEVVRGWPQNGYADQTAEIGRKLNRYYRFHGPMEADSSTVDAEGRITSRRRSFGNVILSRWPIAWSRGVMLPKTRLAEGFDLQCGYIEAVVMAPAGPIRIYGTHLSHVGPAQRLLQVEALLAAARDADAKGATWDGGGPDEFMSQETPPAMPQAAIVAGDFNFTADHIEYPKIAAAGRVDACARMSGETFPGEGRIDHVFVTPDLAPKVKRAWVDAGTPASDHWPVFVEFAL
jgi:endonuclease/exonuclease/phosphatase family metal-dependent hydrolase